ncbi:hypothetical protein KC727_03345 [Candidatus Kaiserbacteria bacterium]|nr:hypothetical protein [Candidatus Kaiserbacteria bacterium]
MNTSLRIGAVCLMLFVGAVSFAQVRVETSANVNISAQGSSLSGEEGVGVGVGATTGVGIEHEDIGIDTSAAGGGTADINIGVGENHTSDDDSTLSTQGTIVSVSAVEVRGWDPERKQALIALAKTEASVHSKQDLELFAQSTLLMHENLSAIEADSESVRVSVRVPAKFLGLFNTSLTQKSQIELGGTARERVSVTYPWYRFLFKLDSALHTEAVIETLRPEVDDEVVVTADADVSVRSAVQARIIAKVVAVVHVD